MWLLTVIFQDQQCVFHSADMPKQTVCKWLSINTWCV